VAYLFLVITDFVTDSATKSMIPDFVANAERSDAYARFIPPHGISPFTVVSFCVVIAVLVAALVGFIGMFCFWRPAPYLFLVSVLARILISPLLWTWHVETGWADLIGSLGTMLDGVIVALVFFGSAKDLFLRTKSPTVRPNELLDAGADGSRSS
jgi:hypothetical protein